MTKRPRVKAAFRWPEFAVKDRDESCAAAIARAIEEHNQSAGMYVLDDVQSSSGAVGFLGKAAHEEGEQVWFVLMGAAWTEGDDSDDPDFEVHLLLGDREEREAEQADGTVHRREEF